MLSKKLQIKFQSQVVWIPCTKTMLKTESATSAFPGDFQNFPVFYIVAVFDDSVIYLFIYSFIPLSIYLFLIYLLSSTQIQVLNEPQ